MVANVNSGPERSNGIIADGGKGDTVELDHEALRTATSAAGMVATGSSLERPDYLVAPPRHRHGGNRIGTAALVGVYAIVGPLVAGGALAKAFIEETVYEFSKRRY